MNPRQAAWRTWQWPTEEVSFRPPGFQMQTPPPGGSRTGQPTARQGGVQPVQQTGASGVPTGGQQPAGTSRPAAPQQPSTAGGQQRTATASRPASEGPSAGTAAAPSIDLIETDDEYVIFADMPGFEEEHIRIEADDESLVLTAQRPDEFDEPARGALLRERPVRVRRRLNLPVGANIDDATARHENGVCTITIPKSTEGDKRTIAFQ